MTNKISCFFFFLLLVVGTLLTTDCSYGASPTRSPSKVFLVDEEQELYQYENNMCGVVSVYYALHLLGQEVSLDEVGKAVPINNGVSSLKDMALYFDSKGIKYEVLRNITLSEVLPLLKPGHRVAILHTNNGKHFVVVFKKQSGELCVIDGKEVIRNNSLPFLQKQFSGLAMVVGDNVNQKIVMNHTWWWLGLVVPIVLFGLIIGYMFSKLYQMVWLT